METLLGLIRWVREQLDMYSLFFYSSLGCVGLREVHSPFILRWRSFKNNYFGDMSMLLYVEWVVFKRSLTSKLCHNFWTKVHGIIVCQEWLFGLITWYIVFWGAMGKTALSCSFLQLHDIFKCKIILITLFSVAFFILMFVYL